MEDMSKSRGAVGNNRQFRQNSPVNSMIISASEAGRYFKRGREKLLRKREKLFVVVGLEEWVQAQRRRRPFDGRHEEEQGSGRK